MSFFYFWCLRFYLFATIVNLSHMPLPERGVLMRQYLKLFAALAIFSAVTGASYGQQQTVAIGEHCLKYRYTSLNEAKNNVLSDCQAAIADNDCGIEDIKVPPGSQFQLTGTSVVQDYHYVEQYLDVCGGVIEAQKLPNCVTSHPVPVSSARKCTSCGGYYCGWTVGGYCSDGTEQACQDLDGGAKIYCDCGNDLVCFSSGPPNTGPLSPKQ